MEVNGGNNGSYTGGKGGKVKANFQFNKSEQLQVNVGGKASGFNGGGTGSYSNGGGATDIRVNGTELTNRIIVAGGGGGASPNGNGGSGGTTEPGTTTLGQGESSSAGTGGGGGYYGGKKGDPVYHKHVKGNGTLSSGTIYSTSNPGGCYVGSGHKHNATGGCDSHTEGEYEGCSCSSCVCPQYSGTGSSTICENCGHGHHVGRCGAGESSGHTVYDCGSPTNTWKIGCGKTEGVYIDSYTASNGGSNYIATLALDEYETTSEAGVQEGNGYVKITLIESYPEVELSGNTTQ